MKCIKCGGPLGPSFPAEVTKTCLKCAGGVWKHPTDFYLPDAYTSGMSWNTPAKTMFPWIPKHVFAFSQMIDFDFSPTPPSDPVLEAIGRAFDDALDLAYLG